MTPLPESLAAMVKKEAEERYEMWTEHPATIAIRDAFEAGALFMYEMFFERIPHGTKLCDCPECGAEIQFGLAPDVLKRMKEAMGSFINLTSTLQASPIEESENNTVVISFCKGEAMGGNCCYPDKSCEKNCQVSIVPTVPSQAGLKQALEEFAKWLNDNWIVGTTGLWRSQKDHRDQRTDSGVVEEYETTRKALSSYNEQK